MSELRAPSPLAFDSDAATDFDVVICGGGLSGLTLAKQLRYEYPRLRVAVVERTARPLPAACHKVGESSVELGSQYFESLGLTEYLLERQLVKFGLRFFPGGGALPIDQRCELGPSAEPIVRSYQLDRGTFEEDLRGMCEAEGVTLFEGAKVREVELHSGTEPHRVRFERDGETTTLVTRWVVDATGRNAVIKRQLKMARGTNHSANAGWFRIEGRFDINELYETDAWKAAPGAEERWRSTNHLMGKGYWVWIIPLAGPRTSIGVVVHDHVHAFDRVRTYERAMDFIREFEPHLARRLEDKPPLDFRCLHGYSHGVARAWSGDRWAIVGEAGAFVDPLYSPGSDFIAFANCFTSELIHADLQGEELDAFAMQLNGQYRSLVNGALSLFRDSATVYGHAKAMTLKVFWDNFSYWSFPCQYFQQGMYRLRGAEHDAVANCGVRFVELSEYVQALVQTLAERHPMQEIPAGFVGVPAYPSVPVDAHLALQNTMTREETIAYMQQRLEEAEALVGEYVVRMVLEYGPDEGLALLEAAGFQRWNLRLPADRIASEDTRGLARRKALDRVARDIERNLGRVDLHPEWRVGLERLYQGRAVAPRVPEGAAQAS